MKLRIFALAALTCLLTACGLSDQQQADYDAVHRARISPAIYDKMVHGDPLSVGDVVALSRAGVSDGVVIRYIRDHGTVYVLNDYDFDQLHQGGVSPSVVDFMAQTGGAGPYGPPPYYGPYGPPIGIGIGIGGGRHWR